MRQIQLTSKAPLFSEADLAANRSGRLSNHQIGQFKRERILWIGLILLPGFSYASLLAIRTMDVLLQVEDILKTFILLTILPMIYAIFRLVQLQAILQKRIVAVVQGNLHKAEVSAITGNTVRTYGIVRARGDVHKYLVCIQESKFTVGEDEFNLFIDGLPYSIYYIPNTMSILSYERL